MWGEHSQTVSIYNVGGGQSNSQYIHWGVYTHVLCRWGSCLTGSASWPLLEGVVVQSSPVYNYILTTAVTQTQVSAWQQDGVTCVSDTDDTLCTQVLLYIRVTIISIFLALILQPIYLLEQVLHTIHLQGG